MNIYYAKQHINIAKWSLKNNIDDLIDYSIKQAEIYIKNAEKLFRKN